MAGNAKIGALHVSLGLDSAQFQTGLKKAETGLGRFSKGAKLALAAVATAAVAAGAALGVAVKGAIDHADNLSKTSQKIGVTTEALSRLEWAAKLSDVSLTQLSTGLKKLSQNLFEVESGAGATAKRGFDALGISVAKADGTLKSADAVLAEVAEQFSKMEDGTEKTAIAVAMFGRAGAELIPMLNMGKAGLADMAAEADRLGITISTRTGKAAEEFNDSLTRLQGIFDGLVNKIMTEALPSLNSLSGTLASPEFQNSIVQATNLIIGLADVLARTAILATELVNILPKATGLSADRPPGWEEMNERYGIGSGAGSFDAMRAIFGGGSSGPGPSNDVGSGAGSFRGMLSTFSTGGKGSASGGVKAVREEIEIAIPRVTEMQQRFIDLGDTIDSSVAGGLSGMVKALIKGEDAVASLAGAFSSLSDKLIDMASDQLINGLLGSFMGIFGGGSGLGSGAFGRGTYGGSGGFFPAFPGYANGTMSAPGGMAWVGERGPELVNLPRGSQVIPNHAIRGGAQDRVLIELGPGLEGRILQKSGQQSVQLIQSTVPGMIDSQAPSAVKRSERNRVTS